MIGQLEGGSSGNRCGSSSWLCTALGWCLPSHWHVRSSGREAVELSAARAGLVATGDLGVALNGVAQISDGVIALDEGVQTRDLLLFYVSQGYLTLRRECGASIQEGDGG